MMKRKTEEERTLGRGEIRRARRAAILRKLTTYAPPELVHAFRVRCVGEGTTMSDVMATLIMAHMADESDDARDWRVSSFDGGAVNPAMARCDVRLDLHVGSPGFMAPTPRFHARSDLHDRPRQMMGSPPQLRHVGPAFTFVLIFMFLA
jgi:hypothetical protein